MTNPPTAAPQPGPVQAPRTNTFAIIAIVTVWFGAILGLVFGYIALSQIKRTGEGGHGLALAAVIIGWIAIGLAIIFTVFWIVALSVAVSNSSLGS